MVCRLGEEVGGCDRDDAARRISTIVRQPSDTVNFLETMRLMMSGGMLAENGATKRTVPAGKDDCADACDEVSYVGEREGDGEADDNEQARQLLFPLYRLGTMVSTTIVRAPAATALTAAAT